MNTRRARTATLRRAPPAHEILTGRGNTLTMEFAYCEQRDLYSWVRYMTASRAETLLAQGDWEHAAEDAEKIAGDNKIAPVARIPALQIFETLGAGPMAGITRRKLRERGVRKIPRGVHERTKQNPH